VVFDGMEKSVMPFPPILHVPTPTCNDTDMRLKRHIQTHSKPQQQTNKNNYNNTYYRVG